MTDTTWLLLCAACLVTGAVVGFMTCYFIWHHPKRDKLGRFSK